VLRARDGGDVLVALVGDALIEPFWPEGLGVNRGFMSALDAAWGARLHAAPGRDAAALLRGQRAAFGVLKSLSAMTRDARLAGDDSGMKLRPALSPPLSGATRASGRTSTARTGPTPRRATARSAASRRPRRARAARRPICRRAHSEAARAVLVCWCQ